MKPKVAGYKTARGQFYASLTAMPTNAVQRKRFMNFQILTWKPSARSSKLRLLSTR